MKSARARFKYALRATKRAEETARADALANELCENDNKGFWKDVSKINRKSNVIANSMDDISGECNISVIWKDHFSSILNSSGNRLSVLLSLWIFLYMYLSHVYLPPDMIKTTIVPIVKNTCGNNSESTNYRPIALATII